MLPSVFLKILRTSNPSMLGRQRGHETVLIEYCKSKGLGAAGGEKCGRCGLQSQSWAEVHALGPATVLGPSDARVPLAWDCLSCLLSLRMLRSNLACFPFWICSAVFFFKGWDCFPIRVSRIYFFCINNGKKLFPCNFYLRGVGAVT